MTGSLLQLVAKGIEDIYLSDNPQISLFKIVYKRHVGFSLFDSIIIPKVSTNFSSKLSIPIPRNGDILTNLTVIFDLPNIYLQRIAPTFEYISTILLNAGITLFYSPNLSTDTVTLSYYDTTIVPLLNTNITSDIDGYNFFNNATMITSNTAVIINPTIGPLTRLNDSTDPQHSTTITNLTTTVKVGRNIAMEIIELITGSFENYQNIILPGLPNNDLYTVYKDNTLTATKSIQLYPTMIRQKLSLYSIILGTIFCYSLDSIIYNCSNDFAINNLDNYHSIGLFDQILVRTGSKSTIVRFNLWNSDDFRYVIYLTYLWNAIRLFFVSGNSSSFYPAYVQVPNNNTLSAQAMSLQSINAGYVTPSTFILNQSLLFYHVLDPSITIFTISQFNIGQNIQSYFNNIISLIYDIITKYTNLFFTDASGSYINVSLDSYTNTDAYKIYNAYIQKIIGSTTKIQSQNQITYIANTIINMIDANIIYNFEQLQNITAILKQLFWTNPHYMITFMKTITVTSSSQLANSTKSSFVNISNSSITNLNDNFITVLNNYIPITVNGVSLTNFYNTDVNTYFNTFINNCQNQLKSQNYDNYTNYLPLWTILSTTNSWATSMGAVSNTVMPAGTEFQQVLFMNFIPCIAVKDIARMIYDVFAAFGYSILVKSGIAGNSSTIIGYVNTLLALIDMRDTNDTSVVNGQTGNPSSAHHQATLKRNIYLIINRYIMIQAVSGSSLSGTLIDEPYFTALYNTYSGNTNTYLLTSTLQQIPLMPAYSVDNGSGALNDDQGQTLITSPQLSQPLPINYKWLPIEWLTQTYYKILSNLINSYFTISDINLPTAKQNLINVLTNVINCFIGHNQIPTFSGFTQNYYTLVGLLPETNNFINTYVNFPYKNTGSYLNPNNTKLTTAPYCDAISTIAYQSYKKYIQLYDRLYGTILLSSSYYQNSLGNGMTNIFNFIKEIIANNNNGTVRDKYYIPVTTPYPYNLVPQTIVADNLGISELSPSVDTSNGDNGFDVYRITDYYSLAVGVTNWSSFGKNGAIDTYIIDWSSAYNYSYSFYNTHKLILNLRNDASNLQYLDTNNVVQVLEKPNFFYDNSTNINNDFVNHVQSKYVNIITDTTLKNYFTTLVSNVGMYWDPSKIINLGNYFNPVPFGIYGVSDALYNTTFNSIYTACSLLSIIPTGQSASDYISYLNNPMTTFFLHDYYNILCVASTITTTNQTLTTTNKNLYTYEQIIASFNILNILMYNGSTPLITPIMLYNDKNQILYTNSSGKIFADVSYVAYYIFDKILQQLNIEKTSLFTLMFNNMTNVSNPNSPSDNGSTDTINQLHLAYLNTTNNFKNMFNQISKLQPTAYTGTINGFNSFYDITNPTYIATFSEFGGTVTLTLYFVTYGTTIPSSITNIYGTIAYTSTYITTNNIMINLPGAYHNNTNYFNSTSDPFFDTHGVSFVDNKNNITYVIYNSSGVDVIKNNINSNVDSLTTESFPMNSVKYSARFTEFGGTVTLALNLLTNGSNIIDTNGTITYTSTYTTTSSISIVRPNFYLSNDNILASTTTSPYYDTYGFALFDSYNQIYYNIKNVSGTETIYFNRTRTGANVLQFGQPDTMIVSVYVLQGGFNLAKGTVQITIALTVDYNSNHINALLGSVFYTSNNLISNDALGFTSYFSNDNMLRSLVIPRFDSSGFSFIDGNKMQYNLVNSGSTDIIRYTGPIGLDPTTDSLGTNLILSYQATFATFGGTTFSLRLTYNPNTNVISAVSGTITYTNTYSTTLAINIVSVGDYVGNDNTFLSTSVAPYFTTGGLAFVDNTNSMQYNIHKSGSADILTYTNSTTTTFNYDILSHFTNYYLYQNNFNAFSGTVSMNLYPMITSGVITGFNTTAGISAIYYSATSTNITNISILPIGSYLNNDNMVVTRHPYFTSNGFAVIDHTNNYYYNVHRSGGRDIITYATNSNTTFTSDSLGGSPSAQYQASYSDFGGTVTFNLILTYTNFSSNVINAVSGTITYTTTYTTTTNVSILGTGTYFGNDNVIALATTIPYFSTSGLAFKDNTNNIKYNIRSNGTTDIIINNTNRSSVFNFSSISPAFLRYKVTFNHATSNAIQGAVTIDGVIFFTNYGTDSIIYNYSNTITYADGHRSFLVYTQSPGTVVSGLPFVNDNKLLFQKPYFTANGITIWDSQMNIYYNINSSNSLGTTGLDIIANNIDSEMNFFTNEALIFGNTIEYNGSFQAFNGTINLYLRLIVDKNVVIGLAGTPTNNSQITYLYTGVKWGTSIYSIVLPQNTYMNNDNLIYSTKSPFFGTNGLSIYDVTNKVYLNIRNYGGAEVLSFNFNSPQGSDTFTFESIKTSSNFALSNGLSTRNTDIVYYMPSTTGSYTVNTDLEKLLLDSINNATPNFAWVNELGHRMMSSIQLSIGGQPIEAPYTPELLHFLYKLSYDQNQSRGYNIMIGNTPEMSTIATTQRSITRLYVPIPYWFDYDNSLPLVSMMYADVVLDIGINDLSNLLYIDSGATFSKQPKLGCKLLVGYAYVEEEYRMKMAQSKSEYLIEKMNYNRELYYSHNDLIVTSGSTDTTNYNNVSLSQVNPTFHIKLNIEDPTKYLIWYLIFEDPTTVQPQDVLNWNQFGYNVRDSNGNMVSYSDIVSTMTIYFGGTVREQGKSENFYKCVQPYRAMCASLDSGMYMYSFALYPSMLQPSGTANFSEMSDCFLDIVFNSTITQLLIDNPNLRVKSGLWGCAYNVLRVMSGCAGLAFFK